MVLNLSDVDHQEIKKKVLEVMNTILRGIVIHQSGMSQLDPLMVLMTLMAVLIKRPYSCDSLNS
jgi:hypothetical protein